MGRQVYSLLRLTAPPPVQLTIASPTSTLNQIKEENQRRETTARSYTTNVWEPKQVPQTPRVCSVWTSPASNGGGTPDKREQSSTGNPRHATPPSLAGLVKRPVKRPVPQTPPAANTLKNAAAGVRYALNQPF